jgi:hypothetical protein
LRSKFPETFSLGKHSQLLAWIQYVVDELAVNPTKAHAAVVVAGDLGQGSEAGAGVDGQDRVVVRVVGVRVTTVPALTVNPYQTVWLMTPSAAQLAFGSPAWVVASAVLRLSVKEPVWAWALAKLSLAGAAAQAGAAATTANAVAAATAVAAPSNRR